MTRSSGHTYLKHYTPATLHTIHFQDVHVDFMFRYFTGNDPEILFCLKCSHFRENMNKYAHFQKVDVLCGIRETSSSFHSQNCDDLMSFSKHSLSRIALESDNPHIPGQWTF